MDRIAWLLRELDESPDITQRKLAEHMDLSLGTVNTIYKKILDEGLITKADYDSSSLIKLTPKGEAYLSPYKVDSAVIIAAGFGSRFVPLTWETPKGLLKVYGECMIERQITQLHQVGITDITIVVGYLKEKFDYLIDKYNVKLLYNPEYSTKNTIATIYHAKDLFLNHNTYLLSSDNWMRENMYHAYEPGPWYSASYMEGDTKEWCLTYNKKDLITDVHVGGHDAWCMYGPVYLTREFSAKFIPVLSDVYSRTGTEDYYWEDVYVDWIHSVDKLDKKDIPPLYINRQPANQVYEFENLEELRAFDTKYNNSSDNAAMELISQVFDVPESDITDIRCLKAGMTNRSFLFKVKDTHYICRVPGEGTGELIDRRAEYDNYMAVEPLHITEHMVYFDPETGYKISEYYEGSRCADAHNPKDMKACMQLLKTLHDSGVTVDHDFDIKERLDFYEKLCYSHGEIPYADYNTVRSQADELLAMLTNMNRPKVLSHIDSVADNFLFIEGEDVPRLIDWEYAGMADPLIDLAMCSIYSYYNKEETDELIKIYLGRAPHDDERKIVYAYMALGGLLWALWGIYKSELGVTFGEYTLIMYRYAKDYYKLVRNI